MFVKFVLNFFLYDMNKNILIVSGKYEQKAWNKQIVLA